MTPAPAAALRRFVRSREPEEHCDTCGAPLGSRHQHNFEPAARRIRCACDSCAVLYGNVYKPIPQRVLALPNFQISDAHWDELAIPISLVFFTHSSASGGLIARYPGPAGAAESMLRLDLWRDIFAENPELSGMQPDVEALLVNRVGSTRDYFIVPIDECYRLVGLIRVHWRGLSGGAVVWGRIAQFFDELRLRETACRG
jgi:hypothetical protein